MTGEVQVKHQIHDEWMAWFYKIIIESENEFIL